MNREIKFRAWDKIDKEMFRVIMLTAPQGKDYLIVSGRGGSTTTDKGNCILMQYTGLKDKNGKEIYEGDILESGNGRLWEVKFGEYKGAFNSVTQLGWFVFGDGNSLMLTKFESESEIIIGNIYQNPELLK